MARQDRNSQPSGQDRAVGEDFSLSLLMDNNDLIPLPGLPSAPSPSGVTAPLPFLLGDEVRLRLPRVIPVLPLK